VAASEQRRAASHEAISAPPPVHFDVDLSQPGSFTWITAELALALDALGVDVSLRPGALSETLGPAPVAALSRLRRHPPPGTLVIGWDYVFDHDARPRDFEFFALNFEFGARDPDRWDTAMRHVLSTPSHKLPISDFCRRVLLAAGLRPERCSVVPLGYSPAVDRVRCPADLPTTRALKLLAVTNAHDVRRYGTDLLLDGFERAFAPRDDVCLVLRDYGAYNAGVAARVARLAEQGYDVLYFARLLGVDDMVRVYRACDALVAPFRGEGFGVKLIDAMACGLPVIAPIYGGPADYLTPENCRPLRYSVVPVGDCLDTRLLPRGNAPVWCEVAVDDLAAALRAAANDPEDLRRRGRRARHDVAQRFSWPAVARRLLEVVMQRPGQEDDGSGPP
jgi:glycosyltransferase involved in cell wall biosynthesis